MPKQASPYLQRLSGVLKWRLQAILRSASSKQRALAQAQGVFEKHFGLLVQYAQRKVGLKQKLTRRQTTELVQAQTMQALTDFGKIYDDRRVE